MEAKIKEAALGLFAARGYESTTMREIGNAVGIRGSSIYAHFKSKEEIFLEVVKDLFKKMVWEHVETPEVVSERKNNDLKKLLLGIFKRYYTFFAEHERELLFWQRIRFFPPSGLEGSYDVNRLLNEKPIPEIYLELFNHGVETRQLKNCPAELLVISFFTFISGYTDSLVLAPIRLSEQQLEKCFEIFWDGIKSND